MQSGSFYPLGKSVLREECLPGTEGGRDSGCFAELRCALTVFTRMHDAGDSSILKPPGAPAAQATGARTDPVRAHRIVIVVGGAGGLQLATRLGDAMHRSGL